MDLSDITYFFDCCIGQWSIERTYHYLTQQEIERSHTDFQVEAISPDLKRKVLTDNAYPIPDHLDSLPGFNLVFHTVSDKGEVVSQELRALFVPKQQTDGVITGDYLRDRAYEEARPIVSSFRYDPSQRELLFNLDQALTSLRSRDGESAEAVALMGSYHHLLRLWADT